MSGFYQTDPDANGIRTETTFTGLTKVGAVNTGRENKTPRYNEDGTTSLVPDPSFNTDPAPYGQPPDDWLMKQRHNPCVQANATAVYFDARYRRTGALIGATELNDPPITTWAGAPANASQISITSTVADQIRYFYAAYTVTFPFSRTLTVQPLGTDAYATHYDPSKGKIWPMMMLGGSPATTNWEGLTPGDASQPTSHPTLTALEVDGVTIPCGTTWNQGGTSGQLSISIRWYAQAIRDL